MKYTVIIRKGDDFGYVAECPALVGCVTQGENYEEALTNIKEAMEVYIESLLEDGRAIPVEVGKEFIELEVKAS